MARRTAQKAMEPPLGDSIGDDEMIEFAPVFTRAASPARLRLRGGDQLGAVGGRDLDLGARSLHVVGPHQAVPPANLGETERIVIPACGCLGFSCERHGDGSWGDVPDGSGQIGWGSSMVSPPLGDIAIGRGVHFRE